MVVVEKGYHANGRERTRPFPCFPNHRIAGTIAHGMTEYLTGPNVFVAGTLSKRERHQEIFEKRREIKGGETTFCSKFVGTVPRSSRMRIDGEERMNAEQLTRSSIELSRLSGILNIDRSEMIRRLFL